MENVNDIFAEFAACFTGTLDGDGEIVHPEQLERGKLDYSLASLKVVDEYLEYLHEYRPEQMGREWVKAVLWGGAYVGEVIRRNASRPYDWVDFDEFIREYPDTTRLLGDQKALGFCALLTAGEGGFTMPINKMPPVHLRRTGGQRAFLSSLRGAAAVKKARRAIRCSGLHRLSGLV